MSFADLAAMETCALDDNRLCGPLPPCGDDLLLRLRALRRFDLRGNLFQDDAEVADIILAGACSQGTERENEARFGPLCAAVVSSLPT